jgi:hypothetical protein
MTDDNPELIAVYLYRYETEPDSDRNPLYATAREIQALYPKTIIGVAARPPGETIESTRFKDQFIERVEQTCVQWEWLDAEIRT